MPAGLFPTVEAIANEQAIAHFSHDERVELFVNKLCEEDETNERREQYLKYLPSKWKRPDPLYYTPIHCLP